MVFFFFFTISSMFTGETRLLVDLHTYFYFSVSVSVSVSGSIAMVVMVMVMVEPPSP